MAFSKENKDTLIYVLLFPNPFEKSNEKMLGKDIEVNEALNMFLKIYRTSFEDDYTNVIPKIAQRAIIWLDENLPEEARSAKIYMRDFLIAIISSVLYTISSELYLKYELLSSRDKDEIFCKVYASEQWLRRYAETVDYSLTFNTQEDQTDFKAVPPSLPINLVSLKGDVTGFKQYDKNDEEVKTGGSLFMYSDKARLVMSALNSKLDLLAMNNFGVIISNYCVHQEEILYKLIYTWGSPRSLFKFQPVNAVRVYFSEKIGIYFSWVGEYTLFMNAAAAFGTVITVLSFITNTQVLNIIFAVFLSFWASYFNQHWTRKEKILSWRWGTSKPQEKELQRPEFKGEFIRDPITNKMKVVETVPNYNELKKLVSYIFIILFICVDTVLILSICLVFTIGRVLPAILNAIQIYVMNIVYKKIAVVLNNWENYETEKAYNENLAVKLFLFQFVNSYLSFFYIGFVQEFTTGCNGSCIDQLKLQLLVVFIFNPIMSLFGLILPWVRIKVRVLRETQKIKELKDNDESLRETMYAVERQSKLGTYSNDTEDYIEIVMRYGYVALFGAALPMLPLLALIEILIKIRVDAWTLCSLKKRPDPIRSSTIGVWKSIMLTIAYAGTLTNSGIIFITTDLIDFIPQKILGFIFLEHLLLLGMCLIRIAIPDTPEIVSKGLKWSKRVSSEKKLIKIYTKTFRYQNSSYVAGDSFLIKESDLNK
jgi:Calcium-activated chloride channel